MKIYYNKQILKINKIAYRNNFYNLNKELSLIINQRVLKNNCNKIYK